MSSTPPESFLSLFLHVPVLQGSWISRLRVGTELVDRSLACLVSLSSLLLCNTLLGKAVHLPLPPVPFIQNGNGGACFGHVRLDLQAFQTFF